MSKRESSKPELRQHITPGLRRALQRRNELGRLIAYRNDQGLEPGERMAWADAVADYIAVITPPHRKIDAPLIQQEIRRIGAPEANLECILVAIDAINIRKAVGKNYLKSAAIIGAILSVKAHERQACAIITIDAIDETIEERRRRVAREGQRRYRRKKGVRPQSESLEQTRPWEQDGISRSTWYRRRKCEEAES